MQSATKPMWRVLVLTAILLVSGIAVTAHKGTSIVRRISFPRGRATAVVRLGFAEPIAKAK